MCTCILAYVRVCIYALYASYTLCAFVHTLLYKHTHTHNHTPTHNNHVYIIIICKTVREKCVTIEIICKRPAHFPNRIFLLDESHCPSTRICDFLATRKCDRKMRLGFRVSDLNISQPNRRNACNSKTSKKHRSSALID